MKQPLQEFVLQCGKLYLGRKDAARVSGIDRAVRFQTRESAEEHAQQLRGFGVFRLPWEVVLSRRLERKRRVSNRLLSLVWGAKPFGSQTNRTIMRLVMAALADQVDEGNHGDWCYPGLLTIQERTEMGRRTVLRALANLKQAGWISIRTRPGYGNAYHFDLEKLTSCATREQARSVPRGHPCLYGTRAFSDLEGVP